MLSSENIPWNVKAKIPIWSCHHAYKKVIRDSASARTKLGLEGASITTSVQGGMWGDARMAARRLAWERLARSLLSCVSSSHRSNSVGPNRSRGSISRTTR